MFSRRPIDIIRKVLSADVSTAFHSNSRLFSNEPEKKNDYFERERKREGNLLLHMFSSKKNQVIELHRYNPLEFSKQRFSEWKNRIRKTVDLENQKYIPERHKILGSDLASANFIVYRGGKVKFVGGNWIEMDKNEECPELPKTFVRGMFLEGIDVSKMNLRYEALENFTNLTQLKWLSLRNCPHVDDWFLDRITGEFFNTLEYLDISECDKISERGLSCIYRLSKLKTLRVSNITDTRSFEFMCLLLEDSLPGLTIEGIKYIDVNCN